MTILSDFLKQASAVDRYMRMAGRRRDRIARMGTAIGAGAGGVLGGATGALSQHVSNKSIKPGDMELRQRWDGTWEARKRKPRSLVGAAIGGALLGGALGAGAGQSLGADSANQYVNRANSTIRRYKQDVANFGSRRAANVNRNFWSKIPEQARNKIKGIARHARNPGSEGENARRILEREAKRHGFNAQHAIKHAAFHEALLGRR